MTGIDAAFKVGKYSAKIDEGHGIVVGDQASASLTEAAAKP